MDRHIDKIDPFLELPGENYVFRMDVEKLEEPLEFYGRSAVYDCFTDFSTLFTDGDDTGSTYSNLGTCRMHLRALEKDGWTVQFPIKNPFALEKSCSYNIWSCSRR